MAHRMIMCLLVMFLAMTSAFSIAEIPQAKGRKLFGGYRIAPKVCQATNPSRIKSDQPAICMFNYECSRRRGEVVGACMDGFLFGACCQLPPKQSGETLEKVTILDDPLINVHEIDHVPDIPILLNPDGTPVGQESTTKSNFLSTKSSISSSSTKDSFENAEKPQLANYSYLEDSFGALLGNDQVMDDLKLPSLITHSDSNNDIQEQDAVVSPVTTVLSPDQIFQVADPVDQLPALFSHGIHPSNDSAGDAETILLNENGTTLHESHNPDELFRPVTQTDKTPSTGFLKLGIQTTTQRHAVTQKTETTERTSTATKAATTPSSRPSTQSTFSYQEKSSTAAQTKKTTSATKKVTTPVSSTTKEKSTYAATKSTASVKSETTTPMTLTTRNADDLVRVPTITYGGQGGNKKHDELDKEEIAINHIISILNDTSDAKVTTQVTNGPTTYKWVSTESSPKPTLVKIKTTRPTAVTTESLPPTYYTSNSSPNHYYYSTATTEPSRLTSYYTSPGSSSSFSTQAASYDGSSSYPYSSRPTTNPPAPTVIVLGPLGTEYTTIPTQSTPTRFGVNTQKYPDTKVTNTIRPSTLSTKKPSVATTLTHNISTVISGNKQVLSVSYISVNLKDGTTSSPTTIKDTLETESATVSETPDNKVVTKRPSTIYTTLTSWSQKPSFHLKPSSPNFNWPSEYSSDGEKVTRPGFTTTGSNCEEETAASDDVNNFPPVRHPELESGVAQLHQDKPTLVEPGDIISEDEIPTPDFVEDAELNNKVDVFVNKIVESLQGNFQNLKDVVYNPKNVTTVTQSATKRPTVSATTKKPTAKPTVKGTRRPTTKLTTTPKTPTLKPRPTSTGTRKPTTTKRTTKPVKRITTTLPSTDAAPYDTTTPAPRPTEVTTTIPEITPTSDFRSICGIRPLMKTGRIVGGKGASFGEWPWQVLVREATWLGLFTKNKCGGVLITDKYVITAAHCQPGFLASLVAVFGEFDISGELESRRSVTRNVRRVIVNRAYDPATFENDLALLELETPIQFDAHIVPICMPDDNTDYVNRMATVTGWGRLKYNGGVPSVLQEVKVPIMENSVCQEMFQTAGHQKLIIDSFMCAGYANGQKDSCEGDSGGPLTLQRPDGRWILVGTVSHGIKCAAPYLPGVYMRTTYFKPWLHSITGV